MKGIVSTISNYADADKLDGKHASELDILNRIAIASGTITHGGTIPLPPGYTQSQCVWMVSTASDNPSNIRVNMPETGAVALISTTCTANASRVVTAQMTISNSSSAGGSETSTINGSANYLIIGVK